MRKQNKRNVLVSSVTDYIKKENKGSMWQLYVAFFCFFLYPVFRDILPNPDLFWAISILAGIYLCLRKFNLHTPLRMDFVFWALIVLVAIGSFIYLGPEKTVLPKRLSLFVLAILMMICLRRYQNWFKPAFTVLLAFLIIEALAVVFFNIMPTVYYSVMGSTIANSSVTVIGPKAGLTSHYSYSGQFAAIGLLMAYAAFRFVERRSISKVKSVALVVVMIVMFVALLLTTKRMPLVLCVLIILFVEYKMAPKGKVEQVLKIITTVLVVIFVTMVFSQYVPALTEVFSRLADGLASTNPEESTTGRTYLWDWAIDQWLASPIFGSGWGTFRYTWLQYGIVSIAAHNVFLQLLAEVGIVGLIVFLIPSISVAIQLLRLFLKRTDKANNSGTSNSVYIAFAAMFQLYFFAYCFIGAPLYDFESFPVYFVLSCGIWYAYSTKTTSLSKSTDVNNIHNY